MSQKNELDPLIIKLLDHMVRVQASDLYLIQGSPPMFRIDGAGYPAKIELDAADLTRMAGSVMTAEQRDEFTRSLEMNLAISLSDEARFRVNVFRQRGSIGMVIRLVRTKIATLDDLNLPPVLKAISSARRGLVLLVGGTGSGKSTTLAAMVDHRNTTETGHIITVEDPIEFIHQHKKCVVTQREVGADTLSYAAALKNTLRQAPDVILIGEIRDRETMEAAISFAETGHLCLSTLHANNANQALERILSFFPPERHKELCLQLSLNLRAIVSQRLVRAMDDGRVAAIEIMRDTPRIKQLIKSGDVDAIKDAMLQGLNEGCQTFDNALFALMLARRIRPADALLAADSRNNLRIRIERYRETQAFEQPYGKRRELRLLDAAD